MSSNSIIIINSHNLDWIKRHPERFVASVVSRIEGEEEDPYPGHARWSGDAMLGVQVVHTANETDLRPQSIVILVDDNSGKKLVSFFDFENQQLKSQRGQKGDKEIIALKKLATKLGFDVIPRQKRAKKRK
jgi:hypothetical protein